jgi:pimeloyl-ACP methyl ester carboxylesterase
MLASGNSRPVCEGRFISIHGQEQWITIRGTNRTNPVLFILQGLTRTAPFLAPWEKDWTIVQWEPPGSGSTYARNPGEGTAGLSFERIARDAIAVSEFVQKYLGTPKIAILATSGGTITGLNIVRARPDLFFAYVGNGQVVNFSRQETLSYEMVLARARSASDAAAVAELEAIGSPPYQTVAAVASKDKYANALEPAEQAVFAAVNPAVLTAMRTPPAGANYVAQGVPQFDARAVSMAWFEALMPEFMAFDARSLGLSFNVPMFFLQGEADCHAVTSEVRSYVAEIQAPAKLLVLIPGAGHMSFFLRDQMLALLNTHLRPLAAS